MGNLLGVNQEPPTKKRKRCSDCGCSDCGDRDGWEATKRIKYDKSRDEIVAEWRFFDSLMRYEQLRWLYAFVGLLGIASGALDMGVIRVILTDWMHVSCMTRWCGRDGILPLSERIYQKDDNPVLFDAIILHAKNAVVTKLRRQRDTLLKAGCDARRICLIETNFPPDGLGVYHDYREADIDVFLAERGVIQLPLWRFYMCVDGMDRAMILSYLKDVTPDDMNRYAAVLGSRGVPTEKFYRCGDIAFPRPRRAKS